MKKTFFWTGTIYKPCSLLVLFFSLCFVGCEKETLLTNTGDHNQSTLDSTRFDVIELEELKTFKPAQQFINEMEPYINTLADSEKEDQFDTDYILRERLDSYSKYYFKTKNFQNLYENGLEFKNLVVTIFPNGEYHMRVILFQYSESNETDGYSLTKNTFVSLKDFQHASSHNKSLQARSSSCFNSLDDALSNCSSIPPTISYYVCNYGYTYIHGPERVGADWCSGSLYWETENLNYTACIEAAHKEYQAFISETDGICDDYEPDSGNNEGHYGTAFDEDQIINKLTGKEKCLYNGLNKQGNSYVKDLMNNFEGTSEFDINIVSKDKVYRNGKEVNAKTTKGKNSNFITIEISTSRATNRAALDVAKTILHEFIHADIFRKLNTKYPTNGDLDFRESFEQYGKDHHKTMANLYVSSMRDALTAFHQNFLKDDYNKYVTYFEETPSAIFYEAIAWRGLKDAGVAIPADKEALIKNEESTISYLSKNCPN